MKIQFKFSKIKWLILPLSGILIWGFNQFISARPEYIESAYSQKIYPFIARLLSYFSNLISFSLSDIIYILLLVFFFILVLLLVFRKVSFFSFGKIILNVLAVIYILFYIFWGFNYFREDLKTRLGFRGVKTEKDQFVTVFEALIEKTNKSVCDFEEIEHKTIDSLIEQSYKKLAVPLKIKYPMGKRTDKKITFSSWFSKATISGYYGPFFNEIHVNKKVLPIEYPFVLAHEKAHQFGITSEAEANFYAWFVCSQSPSKQLQYSANMAILRFFIIQGYMLDDFPEIISKLNEKAKTDFNKIRAHWLSLQNKKIDKAASKANDAYLKSNKIEQGIMDYDGVVKHVITFSLDSVFMNKYDLSTN